MVRACCQHHINVLLFVFNVWSKSDTVKPRLWCFDLLFFLAAAAPREEVGGEFPPLSPDEVLSLSEAPAVTLKSDVSLEMRNSSCSGRRSSAPPSEPGGRRGPL